MQEPSRRSRTRRPDPHTVRLEQELQEMRQQRELDLQRIASLEAQQQRLATFEAQWLQYMAGQLGDGSGGSGFGSGDGGGGSGCGGGGGWRGWCGGGRIGYMRVESVRAVLVGPEWRIMSGSVS